MNGLFKLNYHTLKNEIILYRPESNAEHIEVRLEGETVWLNRQQLATLFGWDVKTIGKLINNVYAEGELDETSTVANFATVQHEGGRLVKRLDPWEISRCIMVNFETVHGS